jgi:hypothetical protein
MDWGWFHELSINVIFIYMNKITKAALVGAMGIGMTIMASVPALAETGGLRDRVKEKMEKKITAVCEAVNKRIDARINNYNERKELHIKKNQANVVRWGELATRLEAKGYDVTKLRADLKTLDGMLTAAATNYASFVSKLETTKDYDCGESKGMFKQSLESSKAELATFRTQARTITDFIKNTIMADLKALRAQKPINKTK